MSDLGWLVLKHQIFGQLWPTKERPVNITLDRRCTGADPAEENKFQLIVKPLDQHHTHGELQRCDKAAVMAALAKCADEIEGILRRVPLRDKPHPTMPLPKSLVNGSGTTAP